MNTSDPSFPQPNCTKLLTADSPIKNYTLSILHTYIYIIYIYILLLAEREGDCSGFSRERKGGDGGLL